jgi:rod shape-determining protein MreB
MMYRFPARRREQADIAIDLGTAHTRVVERGGGISFDQPSLCCFADDGIRPKLIAVGDAASAMNERTSGALAVRRPLARGVLQDINAARELLRCAVRSSTGRRRFAAPRALIGVPADATQAERRALHTAAADAGIRHVRLVREPLLAALGAALPIADATGSLIVECGAGTTEVGVFSLGGFCLARSARGGGNALDKAIAGYIHAQHHFLIGDRTAERLKRALVDCLAADNPDQRTVEIKGRSISDRKPGVLVLGAAEFGPVVARHTSQVAELVRAVLSETPPQLSDDIYDNGVVLTGGSAFGLLAEAISAATGLRAVISDHNEHCVTRGLAEMLG